MRGRFISRLNLDCRGAVPGINRGQFARIIKQRRRRALTGQDGHGLHGHHSVVSDVLVVAGGAQAQRAQAVKLRHPAADRKEKFQKGTGRG